MIGNDFSLAALVRNSRIWGERQGFAGSFPPGIAFADIEPSRLWMAASLPASSQRINSVSDIFSQSAALAVVWSEPEAAESAAVAETTVGADLAGPVFADETATGSDVDASPDEAGTLAEKGIASGRVVSGQKYKAASQLLPDAPATGQLAKAASAEVFKLPSLAAPDSPARPSAGQVAAAGSFFGQEVAVSGGQDGTFRGEANPDNPPERAPESLALAADSSFLPVEYQDPVQPNLGPTDAEKQAYAALKFAIKVNFGQINFTHQASEGVGSFKHHLYTGKFGTNTQKPAPDNSAFSNSLIIPTYQFEAPTNDQAEFKRTITDDWARRAKDAGAKYLAFITKHHTGWCSWDSAYTTYDIASSKTPDIDIPKAVLESAHDFGLKVVLWYSIPDRVHEYNYTNTGYISNNNPQSYEFNKKQIQELIDKDPTGDTILGFWYDLNGNWTAYQRDGHLIHDFKRHVWRQNPDYGYIQLFNQSHNIPSYVWPDNSPLSDVPAYEHPHVDPYSYYVETTDRVLVPSQIDYFQIDMTTGYHPFGGEYDINLHPPTENGQFYGWWAFEDDDSQRTIMPELQSNVIAKSVFEKNALNVKYVISMPAGPGGLFGAQGNGILNQSGKLFNGGGRVDNFDLAWLYHGDWEYFQDEAAHRGSTWLASIHSSKTAGDWAEYKFFGTSVKLYLRADAAAGDADIYIDGILRAKFMSEAATASTEPVLAYSNSALSYAEHTIRVVVGDGKADGFVNIDYLEVAPRIWRIALASVAAASDTYAIGETVEIDVYFNGEVKVTGAPQLEIDVGGQARVATYDSSGTDPEIGSGTRRLRFLYTIAAGDMDADGISISANKLSLNGGTIRVDDEGSAVTTDADLNHAPLAADLLHKVDGSGTTNALMHMPTSGNDRLLGLAGDSSYQLGLASGFDEVYEGYSKDEATSRYLRTSGDSGDVIRLDAGIGVFDVQLVRDSNNVWVQVLGSADSGGVRPVVASIKLVDYYANEQSKVEQIMFADGTVWGHTELESVAIRGSAGNDILYGNVNLGDIFDGSAGGNDHLLGLGGNDEYRLGLASGFDVVYEGYNRVERVGYGALMRVYVSADQLRATGDAADVIRLDAGIGGADVHLVRDSNHVWVQVLGA
ncbi:MAG: alpha-L-fucosidase, partial [Betaproteobacteria bacterium]|nr:alpha-L-fucosidase [Betaproteobacteria bacterium]